MDQVTLKKLTGPYNGLGQKIKFARRVLLESPFHPIVRAFAERAVGQGPRQLQAKRLFRVLKQALHYLPDPVGREYTKAPWVMISEIEQQGYSAGDCDDQATLTYTLLNMIGIPAALRVAWYGKTMPQHIYTVAFINGTWTPYDTTSRYGVEPKASKVMDFT